MLYVVNDCRLRFFFICMAMCNEPTSQNITLLNQNRDCLERSIKFDWINMKQHQMRWISSNYECPICLALCSTLLLLVLNGSAKTQLKQSMAETETTVMEWIDQSDLRLQQLSHWWDGWMHLVPRWSAKNGGVNNWQRHWCTWSRSGNDCHPRSTSSIAAGSTQRPCATTGATSFRPHQ